VYSPKLLKTQPLTLEVSESQIPSGWERSRGGIPPRALSHSLLLLSTVPHCSQSTRPALTLTATHASYGLQVNQVNPPSSKWKHKTSFYPFKTTTHVNYSY